LLVRCSYTSQSHFFRENVSETSKRKSFLAQLLGKESLLKNLCTSCMHRKKDRKKERQNERKIIKKLQTVVHSWCRPLPPPPPQKKEKELLSSELILERPPPHPHIFVG
jgi:hypothetical protein